MRKFWFKRSLIGLLLLTWLTGKAQFPMAAHLVGSGDFDGAREYYMKVLEKDSMNFNANQELGLLLVQYYDQKTEALFYIERAMRCAKQKGMLAELYLGYAQALHFDSQYGKAIPFYEKIIPVVAGRPEGDNVKKQMLLCIENCKYGLSHPTPLGNERILVKNLGTGINSPYPEFLPVVDPDKIALMYTTQRNILLGDKKDGPEDRSYGDMYIAQNLTGKFESALPYHKPAFPLRFLNFAIDQDAVVYMTQNGRFVLFERADMLYLAEYKDSAWTTPQLLPKTINTDPVLPGGACISNDGRIIFFTSAKPGGYGGKDLYRSVLNNNVWTEGENLGPDVNTDQDEESPFLNYDENMLYFSSKGLEGYGGYDVYKVKVTRQGIAKPVNLGLPFNSPADDKNFCLNKDETEGFLASSRKGGSGDLDLFLFNNFGKYSPACSPMLPNSDLNFALRDSAFVNDELSFDARKIKLGSGKIMNYFWKVDNVLSAQDTAVLSWKFAKEGAHSVTLQVATFDEAEYVRKDLCITRNISIFNPRAIDDFFEPLVKKDEDKLIIKGTVEVGQLKVDTTKKELLSIKLEPIFFNTGKSDLRKDAQQAIKRNVSKMKVDASIVVKLTAHTDPRADKEYNMKLSQKRANAVVSALEKSGIKRKRIIAVLAMGEESTNVKKCNGDEACLEKIYQENRRVEFKIVGTEYIPPKQVIAKKGGKKKPGKKKA